MSSSTRPHSSLITCPHIRKQACSLINVFTCPYRSTELQESQAKVERENTNARDARDLEKRLARLSSIRQLLVMSCCANLCPALASRHESQLLDSRLCKSGKSHAKDVTPLSCPAGHADDRSMTHSITCGVPLQETRWPYGRGAFVSNTRLLLS
jgi:hypothetical protein